jgi:hypothetical protein
VIRFLRPRHRPTGGRPQCILQHRFRL